MAICGTIAALATVAGAGMQVAAANQAQSAARSAQRAELARQSEYRKKASATFVSSLAKSAPAEATQQIEKGAQERQTDYAKARSVPLTEGTAPFTGAENSRLISASGSQAQDRLSDAVRARLAGYTDWDMQQAIKNLRANQQLAQIGNFASGSVNVLPLELNDAAHSADTLAGIGSLIGTAGNLGSAWAAAQPQTVKPVTQVAPLGSTDLGFWGGIANNAPQSQNYYNFITGRMN